MSDQEKGTKDQQSDTSADLEEEQASEGNQDADKNDSASSDDEHIDSESELLFGFLKEAEKSFVIDEAEGSAETGSVAEAGNTEEAVSPDLATETEGDSLFGFVDQAMSGEFPDYVPEMPVADKSEAREEPRQSEEVEPATSEEIEDSAEEEIPEEEFAEEEVAEQGVAEEEVEEFPEEEVEQEFPKEEVELPEEEVAEQEVAEEEVEEFPEEEVEQEFPEEEVEEFPEEEVAEQEAAKEEVEEFPEEEVVEQEVAEEEVELPEEEVAEQEVAEEEVEEFPEEEVEQEFPEEEVELPEEEVAEQEVAEEEVEEFPEEEVEQEFPEEEVELPEEEVAEEELPEEEVELPEEEVAELEAAEDEESADQDAVPEPHDSQLPMDFLASKYAVLGVHGETELSSACLAREVETGRIMVLKTLRDASPMVKRRFAISAQRHLELDHENIVSGTDYLESPTGDPFFVMECLEGISLQEMIDEVEVLDNEEEIASFIEQICDGLEYAHDLGIVHGGLKPSNIMLTQPGEEIVVKLLDFGYINYSRELPNNVDKLIGPYTSPEQLSGKESTEKSDVFSLGVLSYQLITGVVPPEDQLSGKTPLTPVKKFRPDLPDVALLSVIIGRALKADPADRFESIADVRDQILNWYYEIEEEEPDDEKPEIDTSEVEDIDVASTLTEVPIFSLDQALTRDVEMPAEPSEKRVASTLHEIPAIAPEDALTLAPQPEEIIPDFDVDKTLNEIPAIAPEDALMLAPEPEEVVPDFDVAKTLNEIPVVSAQDALMLPPDTGADSAPDEEKSDQSETPVLESTTETESSIGLSRGPMPDLDGLEDLIVGGVSKVKNETPTEPSVQKSPRLTPEQAALERTIIEVGLEQTGEDKPDYRQQIESEILAAKSKPKRLKKKPRLTKRKGQVKSTFVKLMALKETQTVKEDTAAVKFTETFADQGTRQSPVQTGLRIVAVIAIIGGIGFYALTHQGDLQQAWDKTSRIVSSALLGEKSPHEPIEVEVEEIKAEDAAKLKKEKEPKLVSVSSDGKVRNVTRKVKRRHKRNVTHKIIQNTYISPKFVAPTENLAGPRQYAPGQPVHPYLFTKERIRLESQRNNLGVKKNRPGASQVKNIK